METIEISKDRKLNPGDIVRMTYKASGATWLKATEAALVESRLQRKEGFYIKSIDYQTPGKIIFTIRVTKTNPIIVTVGYISSLILGAVVVFLAAGWMFEKAELVFEKPAVKYGSAAVLILVVLIFLSYAKGSLRAFRS